MPAALDGTVAIVTGASRGIGKGVALGLGEAGAIVYVTGRAVVALAADAKILEKTGQALNIFDLADAYGFTDIDGSRPTPLQPRRGAT